MAGDLAAVRTLFPSFAELATDAIFKPETVYYAHNIDLGHILRKRVPKDISLGIHGRGMAFFQNYPGFYEPWRDRIRDHWLVMDSPLPPAHPDDIAIHLRFGDLESDPKLGRSFPIMPFEYYEFLLDRLSFRKLHLVTTAKQDHPMIQKFLRWEPEFIQGNQAEDFKALHSFNRIALPISTFSWWATYLSEAREIFFPVFDHGLWWGRPDVPHAGVIDLRVHEPRYIYYRPPSTWRPGRPPRRYPLSYEVQRRALQLRQAAGRLRRKLVNSS
jgi:hypothetical protein